MHTPAGQKMPRYKPIHAEIYALPIKAIAPIEGKDDRSLITFESNFYVPVEIETKAGTFDAFEAGDYYVVDHAGHASVVDKATFEAAAVLA